MSAQEFVENDPEAINLAGRADARTAQLLRTGISRRHEDLHAGSEIARLCGPTGTQELRDTKIQQLRYAFSRHQDVARFDVAMNHEILMRILQSGTDLAKQFQALRRRERSDI